MRVVIPVAGMGTRLRPHTFTLPKPLIEVAGNPIIDYIIDDCLKLKPEEIIFVLGYRGPDIKEHVERKYPELNSKFVYQEERDGNGSAIRIGLEHVKEEDELFIVFGDTLVDFDYKEIIEKSKFAEALVLGMEVVNPSHYGVMNIRDNMDIYEVEEKPQEPKSNLAVIGAYYFKSLQDVKKSLKDFYRKKETVNGEYNIIQVIERYINMLHTGVKAVKVKNWFDCGRYEVILDANQYFLEKRSVGGITRRGDSLIIAPSFVSKNAVIKNSIIGPYAAIGDGVEVNDSFIKNSIVSSGAKIESAHLRDSLISRHVKIIGKSDTVNVGERSEIFL